MAEIKPFRGTFYNPEAISDPADVLAPPYDIIDNDGKQVLANRSPYNIVRLILPQSSEEREFWNTSAGLFEDWKRQGILINDRATCLYAYRQTFNLPGSGSFSRLGILTALKCKDFSSGEVLPHEKTFPRTRDERLKLLRACRANFSQVFMTFRDHNEKAADLLLKTTGNDVFMQFDDDEGTHHQLWRIAQPDNIEALKSLLFDQSMIIADGHHRYETALAYSKEINPNGQRDSAAGYVCATIFRSEDPGLIILPVHRVLRCLPPSWPEEREKLAHFFELQEMPQASGSLEGAGKMLEGIKRAALIMVTSQSVIRMILKKGVDLKEIVKGPESKKWKSLDISILHSLVLEQCLNLDADDLAEKGELYFTPWESVARKGVAAGKAEACFLVRATRIEDIWEIAEGGERMPPKSSYFYPKLPSGLMIYDHRNAF